jgi:hypothetical protein
LAKAGGERQGGHSPKLLAKLTDKVSDRDVERTYPRAHKAIQGHVDAVRDP